jgi:hypothetical protein
MMCTQDTISDRKFLWVKLIDINNRTHGIQVGDANHTPPVGLYIRHWITLVD